MSVHENFYLDPGTAESHSISTYELYTPHCIYDPEILEPWKIAVIVVVCLAFIIAVTLMIYFYKR